MIFLSTGLDHLSVGVYNRGPIEKKLTNVPDFTQVTTLLVAAVQIDGLSVTSTEDGGCVVNCETCHAYFTSLKSQPERERGESQ